MHRNLKGRNPASDPFGPSAMPWREPRQASRRSHVGPCCSRPARCADVARRARRCDRALAAAINPDSLRVDRGRGRGVFDPRNRHRRWAVTDRHLDGRAVVDALVRRGPLADDVPGPLADGLAANNVERQTETGNPCAGAAHRQATAVQPRSWQQLAQRRLLMETIASGRLVHGPAHGARAVQVERDRLRAERPYRRIISRPVAESGSCS